MGETTQERYERLTQDPTALTLAQIEREITHLSEQVSLRIDGLVLSYDTRLNAIDRATDKFEASLTRVPTDVDRQTGQLRTELLALMDGLKAFHDQKFAGVDDAFSDLRAAIEKSERVTKVAVDAALEAAGKANAAQAETFLVSSNKTEANFTKLIEQLGSLIQANTRSLDEKISAGLKGLDDKIADSKERLTRSEGQSLGQQGSRSEGHTTNAFIVSLIGVLVALLSIGIALWRAH
jgi:hypothetical protein